MGIAVEDLSAPALFDKMVRRRRGGYCFEQNSLMRYVLTELGYGVEALTGRVVWMNPAGLDAPPTALTHMVLLVSIPGVDARYLVDVGFGGQTLTSPIRLEPDEIQATRHEPYRVRTLAGGYALETLIRDDWQPLYLFTRQPDPDRPASRQLVCVDSPEVDLRGRIERVPGHRRHAVESARPQPDCAPDPWAERACPTGQRLTGPRRTGQPVRLDVGGLGDVHARITEVLDT